MQPFLIHNKILYVTTAAFLFPGGKTRSNIDTAVSQKSKAIAATKIPELGAGNYFIWDKMSNGWRECIEAKYGNPYDYVAREPIMNMIGIDGEAEQFFIDYQYGELQKKLPLQTVRKYTMAASVLKLNKKVVDKRSIVKKELGLTVPQFYEHLQHIITTYKNNGKVKDYAGVDQLNGDFPSSYQRLLKKTELFVDKGYEFLIDEMFGNSISAKVNDETSLNYLKTIIEHPYQYDDVMVCFMYNKWAVENGYKKIEPQTVGNKRREYGYELDAVRYGKSVANSKYIKQVKGSNPSKPFVLYECDDYYFNAWYQNEEGNLYARYVSYVVMDSFNSLVLGKSYKVAKAPTYDMILEAWVDAMYYIKNLVNDGNWYLPFEVKADHWQKGKAFDFFKTIGNFVAPALHNKQRGYIEPFFGSPHAKRAEKIALHNNDKLNYNGNNTTAGSTGVNLELIKNLEKSRPFIGNESISQVETYFSLLQTMPSFTRENMNASSREQQWLEAFNKLPIEDKRPISDEKFLLLFGKKHEPQGRQISITNRGIEPQINDVKYSYDLPNHNEMMHLIGSKVSVIYDERDMSRVLITNYEDIRFIATAPPLQARALRDATEGSRTSLNKILEDKKTQWATIDKKSKDRKELMLEDIDPKAIMVSGMMRKELRSEVEQLYVEHKPYAAIEEEEEDQPFNLNEALLNR